MLSTLITVATASIVGSLHCAAMCGGLVSFTCGTSDRPRLAQLSYHGGRLAIYASLGAIAGYAGQTLNRSTDVVGLQSLAALVTGLSMVAWALFTIVRRWMGSNAGAAARAHATAAAPIRLSTRQPKPTRLSLWFARLHQMPSALRGALLGLTSAVLPCGWLYAFVATAAGQGSPSAGAFLMVAFWLGTLPMLVGLGGLVSLVGAKVRSYLPHVSTVVLLLLGLSTVISRNPGGLPFTHASTDANPQSSHQCH